MRAGLCSVYMFNKSLSLALRYLQISLTKGVLRLIFLLVFSLGSFFVPCRCVFRDGYESWDTMHASFVSYVMMRAAPEFDKQQADRRARTTQRKRAVASSAEVDTAEEASFELGVDEGAVLVRPDPTHQHCATRGGTAAGHSVASTSSDAYSGQL